MVQPAELLLRPPEEGARLLALSYLEDAAAAHSRLGDPDDTEGLHDFRVALRRLRSCIRSYRRELEDELSSKTRRRLRRLADSTGPARDLEVQLGWLRGSGHGLGSYHRHGLSWFVRHLEERQLEALVELDREVSHDFATVQTELRRELSVYRAEIQLGAGPRPTFGGVTAAVVERHGAELVEALGEVTDAADVRRAHRARIAAKRLRYLLDPLGEEVAGIGPLVKQLKRLQEVLGELHDAHVLEADLGQALAEAAAQRARRLLELSLATAPDAQQIRAERRRAREPGLLVVAGRNRQRRNQLFERLQEDWLGGGSAGLAVEIVAIAGEIEKEIESARAAAGTPSVAAVDPGPRSQAEDSPAERGQLE